ncbi:MAG: hypothetical protein LBV23_09955 [Deltaproteobacteria bacterium]|jgi:hypothetical protein|nr:hypothetical protein [Deltaproteobacteria bacterium]
MSQSLTSYAPKAVSLTKLLSRLYVSVALALLGSWGLIVPRLNFFKLDDEIRASKLWLYLDAASLALAILGVVLCVYYKQTMTPRLRRVDDLGEAGW